MKLEQICTTQETSRKLKEAGFPQEKGIAYWVNTKKGWEFLGSSQLIIMFDDYYRAFTFNELWDILPEIGKIEWWNTRFGSRKDMPPQEAAAELALWCVKEGYLNPKEDNNG